MMQGSFDSSAQADEDSTYYNISLHMYPIWESKGKYLYVEQALASRQSSPYRQRIYHLTELSTGEISSAVYSIPADSIWIGKWRTPAAFNSLSPSDLSEREGCAVILKQIDNNSFQGSTGDKTCVSTLRGASYANSIVTVQPNQIVSWDQGFDEEGNQVWGATEGGYSFDRIGERPDWLVGSWKRNNNHHGQTTFEEWRKINETMYKGLGYTMQAQDTVFKEDMTLFYNGDNWQCTVVAGEYPPVTFKMVHLGVDKFILRNNENDFPKVIKYWREDKKLKASISGGAEEVNFDFSIDNR